MHAKLSQKRLFGAFANVKTFFSSATLTLFLQRNFRGAVEDFVPYRLNPA
jgi:hypothetical protein